MLRFLRQHPRVLCVLLFCVLGGGYFATQLLPLTYHVVHLSLDDAFPFLPVFILPYIVWYAYVPLPLLYMSFRDREIFRRQMAVLFSGAYLCLLVFVLYPTCVDFRPSTEGEGALLALCRIIYANDQPVNVFPSLHCYETTAIYLATFRSDFGRQHPALRAVFAVLGVLICLSTLFVRQHSVLDLISGCGLAVLVYLLVDRRQRKKGTAYADAAL